jgi:hypothetical protein
MARRIPALLICLPLLLACGVRRPAQVPKEAVQVGPKEGGAWVLVGPRQAGRWPLRVWDRDGALKADGAYVPRGMARVSIEAHEPAAWDGRQLALKDGTLLVPAP